MLFLVKIYKSINKIMVKLLSSQKTIKQDTYEDKDNFTFFAHNIASVGTNIRTSNKVYNSDLPANALISVTSSAYSISAPTGIP